MAFLPVRPKFGKTYFLEGTDGVWDWISEGYEYVTGKITGTWQEAKQYYDVIKNRWNEFITIRPSLDSLVVRLSVARMKAEQKGDIAAVDNIDDLRLKVKSLTELWIAVKEKYDKYIGSWISAEQKSLSGLGSLGIAPIAIIIGVAAVTAISFVAVNMVKVIGDSKQLNDLTSKVEQGLITPETAIKIYKETRQTTPTITEKFAETIGGGIGKGLTVAIVGAVVVAGSMYLLRRK